MAKNSLQHHVESISYRYQLAYEEMINIVLNCTERKTFNLGKSGGDLRPGPGRKGWITRSLSRITALFRSMGIIL